MLTKEYIQNLKTNSSAIEELIKNYKDSSSLTFILESLGQLPADFDGDFFIDLLKHKNAAVRLWTIKTLGKLKQQKYLIILKEIALNDTDTTVRREAVSSIGRMRNENTKKDLIEILKDSDPKVVCQAIRGLLVFKGDNYIDNSLKSLVNHENEIVRAAINKAYFSKKQKKDHKKHSEANN